MVAVCQKCGDHGFLEALIYCAECGLAAEHSYCLDRLPKNLNEDVSWKCQDCISRLVGHSTIDSSSPLLSVKSIRSTQVAQSRIKWKWKKCYRTFMESPKESRRFESMLSLQPDESQIGTLSQDSVEEQPPTGKTVTEGFAEDRTCNFVSDGFTETRVLTDSIPHEADATERSVVVKDHVSVANEVIDKEAHGDTAIIAGAFPYAISESMVSIPDVKEAITVTLFHEVLPISALQGHQEGGCAYSLDQGGIQSSGASSSLHVSSALNELIRGASESEVAPAIAHNEKVFLSSALQGCDGGQCAHSPDRESRETIGTSVLHMATAFDDVSLGEATTADNSAKQVGLYSVKRHLAPILRAIIDKHGDIARDCPLKCSEMLTSALERVCRAVQDFEAVHFINLRSYHLKSLYSAIEDAELVKLDVKWLHNRYNEVMETVHPIKQYKNIKVAESKKRALELKKTKMMKLQSDIQSLESEVAVMEAENERLNGVICSVKSKSKQFRRNSLMDGLL